MTTTESITTPDVPLPIGADATPEFADDWQPDIDGVTQYRCVWSPRIGPHEDTRAVVIQYADGTIGTEGDDAPLVYIGADDYSLADARRIAETILQVADLADRWAGRNPVVLMPEDVAARADGDDYDTFVVLDLDGVEHRIHPDAAKQLGATLILCAVGQS